MLYADGKCEEEGFVIGKNIMCLYDSNLDHIPSLEISLISGLRPNSYGNKLGPLIWDKMATSEEVSQNSAQIVRD